MAMGLALWYNPITDKEYTVSTHDQWLKNPDNAKELGLSPATQQVISNSTDEDEIRMAAIMNGMVRIRDYKNYISVQFRARRRLNDLLFKIYEVLKRNYGPHSWVTINNMATNETTELSVLDLGQRLRDDTPILFREESDGHRADVPNDQTIVRIIERKLNCL